jgi:hypothetical protein
MKFQSAVALLIAALGIGFASAFPPPLTEEEKGRWLYDLDAAQRQARQQNRLIFAVLVCGH